MEGNIFDRYYGDYTDFVKYYKQVALYKYEHINSMATYLRLSQRFTSYTISYIFPEIINSCIELNPIESNKVIFNDSAIKYIMKYFTSVQITDLLTQVNHSNYDNFFNYILNNSINKYDIIEFNNNYINKYDLIELIFDKIKITDEQYNKLFKNNILDNAEIVCRLLVMCESIGLYPSKDIIYHMTSKGIRVKKYYLIQHNIDDNDISYVVAQIAGNLFDFKKYKSIKINLEEAEKELVKETIFANVRHYTESQVNMFANIFNIVYDNKCLQILIKNEYCNPKLFKYLIKKGVTPDYDMLCILVNRLKTVSQIKKYF
jgi:hypothetical protein